MRTTRVGEPVEGFGEHLVANRTSADEHFVEGPSDLDQVVGGCEVGGVELLDLLALGVVELIAVDAVGTLGRDRVDLGEVHPGDVES